MEWLLELAALLWTKCRQQQRPHVAMGILGAVALGEELLLFLHCLYDNFTRYAVTFRDQCGWLLWACRFQRPNLGTAGGCEHRVLNEPSTECLCR